MLEHVKSVIINDNNSRKVGGGRRRGLGVSGAINQ